MKTLNQLTGLMVAVMLLIRLAASAAVQESTPQTATLPPAPEGYQWELIPALSDEFGGSRLDPNKWLDFHPYWKGRQPSRFEPKNVSVHDGLLALQSTSLTQNLAEIANPKEDIWVAGACVSSVKPSAHYGYYEARLKASALTMTSSFWMQGKFSEIDIVEQLGRPLLHPDKQKLMLMNTHYFKEGWDKDIATPKQWQMDSGAADDYHIYGVWWKDPNTIAFYHHGQRVAQTAPGGAFTEPMYLFFDAEIFTWEGLPGIQSLSDPKRNTMLVDWIRSWRLVPVPAKP